MRIEFVYVTTASGKEIPVNPEALEFITEDNSSTRGGAADLHMRSGNIIQTNISVKKATNLFKPMNIAV